jgi:hypothetical protein
MIGVRDYAQYLASLKSSKFQGLLPAQAHILGEYAGGYAQKRDVGVELPTGGGKTLIALLAAGAWLEERRSVVILSANCGRSPGSTAGTRRRRFTLPAFSVMVRPQRPR